jgi:hypothetical protein
MLAFDVFTSPRNTNREGCSGPRFKSNVKVEVEPLPHAWMSVL